MRSAGSTKPGTYHRAITSTLEFHNIIFLFCLHSLYEPNFQPSPRSFCPCLDYGWLYFLSHFFTRSRVPTYLRPHSPFGQSSFDPPPRFSHPFRSFLLLRLNLQKAEKFCYSQQCFIMFKSFKLRFFSLF